MQGAKRFKPPTVYWPDILIVLLNIVLNNKKLEKSRKLNEKLNAIKAMKNATLTRLNATRLSKHLFLK